MIDLEIRKGAASEFENVDEPGNDSRKEICELWKCQPENSNDDDEWNEYDPQDQTDEECDKAEWKE